jgi:hypothetical protein
MAKNMTIIGRKGIDPTTHCYLSGQPLKKAPINYDLGGGWYISVNVGRCLSTQAIEQVADELHPFLDDDSYEEKEVIIDDN